MHRIRSSIIWIRRAGVPHEETVIIPAIALYVTFSVSGESGWRFWVPGVSLAAISFVCGAWLGLAWRGFPTIRVVLRTVYIGVLAVLIYMLMHDEPVTKREATHAVSLIVSSVGYLFYFGFFYAAIMRDVALRRFSSEKQLQRYHARKAYWRYIWRLSREQEDKTAASDWDLYVSKLVQSLMDVKGLIALGGLLVTAFYYLWLLLNFLLPSPGS